MPKRTALCVTTGLVAAGAWLSAAQSTPPRLPKSVPNAYELLALGPPPAVTCTCLASPFALPAYQPASGHGTGAAVPFTNAPLSDAERRRNAEWDVQEEREIRLTADEGLAGNANASLAVALHLGLHAEIFGRDERTEEQVVRWLTLAAGQGHADAFPLLAHRYAAGSGVAQDYTAAAYWFDQGARHGDAISMTAIGFLRAAGRGVAQSWPEAVRWWRRAENRTPVASRYLGDAYACGLGVDEDHERAVATYRRVADQEISSAIQLGYMYLRGCPVIDEKAALAEFQRAADRGDPEAQIQLSEVFRLGRGGDVNLYMAYLWARVAERRLDAGEVKKRAEASAAAAARLMSAFEIADADRMIADMIARAATPLR